MVCVHSSVVSQLEPVEAAVFKLVLYKHWVKKTNLLSKSTDEPKSNAGNTRLVMRPKESLKMTTTNKQQFNIMFNKSKGRVREREDRTEKVHL